MPDKLTHFDSDGRPHMVDVSEKQETARVALARGRVLLTSARLMTDVAGGRSKGDVASIAELAGIMAAKRTGDLIPLCHPLPLSSVAVSVIADEALPGYLVTAEAKCIGRTGVEMEAMTAVSVACLCIYDMLKSRSREIVIERIELMEKRGGKSGDWQRGA